jgi:hypothetical protein
MRLNIKATFISDKKQATQFLFFLRQQLSHASVIIDIHKIECRFAPFLCPKLYQDPKAITDDKRQTKERHAGDEIYNDFQQ